MCCEHNAAHTDPSRNGSRSNQQANSRGQIIQLTPESRVNDSGRDKSFGREIYIFTLSVSGDKKWLIGSKNPELVARWIEGIFAALRRLWISQEQKGTSRLVIIVKTRAVLAFSTALKLCLSNFKIKNSAFVIDRCSGLSEPAAEKKPAEKVPESPNHRNGHASRVSVDEHVNCMLRQSNRSVYRKFGHEGVYIEMSPADRLAQSREARENSMDELDGMREDRNQFDMEVDWQLLSVSNGLRIFEEKKVR